ncbi:MAG: cytidine deaminase [Oscillospiraceae bacterium]|jgi:cytidine deaminase|nr:cytidine deaminase [Oscillospiraceae bacterium]
MDDNILIREAQSAREQSYCPYSGYAVGACLESKDGRLFKACNVENASYGLSICAERAAVALAVSRGAMEFTRIAVAAEGTMPYPCGACLQVLREFGADDMEIITASGTSVERGTLGGFLPARFALDKSDER